MNRLGPNRAANGTPSRECPPSASVPGWGCPGWVWSVWHWSGWVAALAILLGGCQPRNEFVPPPPPEVSVAQPVEQPVVETMDFTGTTRATATVELRARVNGYLEKIAFQDGADV